VEGSDEVLQEHGQQEQVREKYSLQINFIGTWPKRTGKIEIFPPD
jgi:hypothetical protein